VGRAASWPAALATNGPAAIRAAAQNVNRGEILWRCVMLHPSSLTELASIKENGPNWAVFEGSTTENFLLSN
jgi:hypothetical protein